MWTDFFDDLGDTLFAVAVAGAIAFGAANLAVRVNLERAAFDTAHSSQKLGELVNPPPTIRMPTAGIKGTQPGEAIDQLNY
jgi:hypothetical protein